MSQLLEYVLTGFGPCEPPSQLPSWLARMLGSKIVNGLDRNAAIGNGRPMVLELQGAFSWLCTRRPEDIRAHMALLEEELAEAERVEVEASARALARAGCGCGGSDSVGRRVPDSREARSERWAGSAKSTPDSRPAEESETANEAAGEDAWRWWPSRWSAPW